MSVLATLMVIGFNAKPAFAIGDGDSFEGLGDIVLLATVGLTTVAIDLGFTIYDVAAEPKKDAAIAELIFTTPTAVFWTGVATYQIIDGEGDEAIFPILLAGWSSALVYHGVSILTSSSKDKGSAQSTKPRLHFAPTLVSSSEALVPGLGISGAF